MDTEYVVCWFVGVSAALSIVRHFRAYRFRAASLLAVNVLVLAIVVLGGALQLPHAGWVALAAWLSLSIVPSLASKRAMRWSIAQRFGDAARAARLAALLHPFGGNREHALYLVAQARADSGDFDGARRRLEALAASESFGQLATLELLRLDARWEDIVQLVDRKPAGTREMNVLPFYLRALGETGRVDRALSVYRGLPRAVQAVPVVRLLCAAFAGRRDWVRRLLEGALSEMRGATAAYWLAVADQAAGDDRAARLRLEPLSRERGPLGRQAAFRLEHPLPRTEAGALSAESRQLLSALEEQFAFERHLSRSTFVQGRPVATWGLMALLAAVFLASVPSGSTSVETLVNMGALVLPVELVGGEFAWRVVAAGFLHFGATHLILNLVGLWNVGTAVERIWDGPRMLFVFLAASLGAFAFAPFFMGATLDEPRILLGASAGVLGLVGALTAFSAIGFFYGRNKLLRERLQAIGIVLAIQIAFDASTPMVSSTLHVLGFLFGALAAAPFAATHWRRARAAAAA